jgi:hypothetical protein
MKVKKTIKPNSTLLPVVPIWIFEENISTATIVQAISVPIHYLTILRLIAV